MSLDEIENGVWRLAVAPATGASVAGLALRLGDHWEPLLRPTPPDAVSEGRVSNFSSFTLAPFSNRLKGARFRFAGQDFSLRATTPDGNAQHGDVRSRPWQPLHRDARTIEYGLTSTQFSDFNFPFPFFISVSYRLDGARFLTTLRLKNIGEAPMPAGFGLHPYFQRQLEGSGEIELGFAAAVIYEVDDGLIPTGTVKRPTGTDRFEPPHSAGELAYNHLYRGWSEPVTLTWPGVARLELRADPVFSHLVVFTAPDGSLAVEPVTNATDGFNLLANGFDGSGVQVLAPGETLEGTVTLEYGATET